MIGVSGRELARQFGVSETAVRKARKSGRIQQLADGSYDPQACAAAWKSNSDPARSQVRAPVRAMRSDAIQDLDDAADAITLIRRVLQEEGLGHAGPLTYEAARIAELVIKARERQFNMDVKAGKLVEAEAAKAAWKDELRQFRSAMLAVPSRVRQLLGHLSTHDIATIDRVIRDALANFGRDAQGSAAGGSGDGGPASET